MRCQCGEEIAPGEECQECALDAAAHADFKSGAALTRDEKRRTKNRSWYWRKKRGEAFTAQCRCGARSVPRSPSQTWCEACATKALLPGERQCRGCPAVFPDRGCRMWCTECAVLRARERAKAHGQRKKSGAASPQPRCVECGGPGVEHSHGRCEGCKKLREADQKLKISARRAGRRLGR